jgi:hypothetical protein
MQLVMLLGMRSRIAAVEREHPELLAQKIEAPLFIIGLPRTGTTLLHNSLAGHPSLRAPKLWEMRSPVPGDREQAVAETQNLLDMLYAVVPGFDTIHPMSATRPDECSWLFRHTFASMVYAFTYYAPSYVEWLTSTEMETNYRYYRSLLQLMQWQSGETKPRRWVLKDPCHLWHLDSLFRVFPDAQVVMLHRPLDEALPSMASLCYALQHVESERKDPRALSGYCLDLADRGLHAMMRLRPVMLNAQVHDLSYRRLIADPAQVLSELCKYAGVSAEPTDVASMMSWVHANGQHAAGRHRYSREQFGFEPAQVRARFARYEDRFARVL